MTGIIITGHGMFPVGFLSACELIAGDLNQICGVCFDREPEQLEHALKKAVEDFAECGKIIIFCDIPGGTPFKTAAELAVENDRIEVIAGVSLPLLLEVVLVRDYVSDFDPMLSEAIHTAKEQILRLDCKVLTESAQEEPEEGI